jgi:propanol-preferring alcohol dehydrogenase
MKKLMLQEGGKLVVGEAPMPEPGAGEVLIKMASTVVCGSEIKGYKSGGGVGNNSGHEGAGTVVKAGDAAGEALVGKRVGASAITGCGTCPPCLEKRYTWCRNKFRFHGGMHAEYISVPIAACAPLPDSINWDCGALVSGDGLGVPFHTNTKIIAPETVKTVAVFGLGPIGLGSVLLQSFLGRKVIGVDLSPDRLAMAKSMGAAETIKGDETDAVAAIKELTGGLGADVCIEAVGIPKTVEQCLAAVKTGGQVLLDGEQPEVTISPSNQLIRRDITMTGCWFYHFCEIQPMICLVEQGLPVEKLVTHRFPGSEAPEGFRLFAEGKTGKVALHW